jgi:hypothetical protein
MRITRPIVTALLLTFAAIPFAAPVRAQGSADDPTTAMARARFKEGVEFYDKGEFEQARVSFLQAYALKKHPLVLLNLAWSCVKSGHAVDADRYFKQFLAEGKDITEKQRADANDGLAQARTKMGRIEVVAAAGTEVTVDGDRIGTVPLADSVVVEVGAHTVKFKAPDGTTDTESITVTGGEKAVARFKAPTPAPAAAVPTQAPTTVAPPPAPAQEAPPAAPTPPPPAPKARAPEAAVRRPEASSSTEAGAESGGGGALAPPRNVVPIILLGGVAVAGFVGAGLFADFKSQAQNKADDLFVRIQQAHGVCPAPANQMKMFGPACDAWQTDTDQVNQDATWGNILLGVGIAATAGAIVYWLVADKHEDTHAAARPVIAPLVGPRIGGLMLSDQF